MLKRGKDLAFTFDIGLSDIFPVKTAESSGFFVASDNFFDPLTGPWLNWNASTYSVRQKKKKNIMTFSHMVQQTND